MKRTTRNLALAGLMSSVSLGALSTLEAATIDASSVISGVVLYPDAAIIKRQIEIEVSAGEHEVMLADLPSSLDPASFRIEGSAAGRLVIGNVDFRLRASLPDAEKPETQRRLKALRADRDRVTDRIEAVEGRKAMIQRMANGSENKDAKPLDIEQWARAWELVGKGLLAINDELRALRNEEARISAEIAAIEGDGIRPLRKDTRRVAAITIDAAAPTKVLLTVSYRVSGVGWRPIYDARLETRGATPALELTRRAMIRQNSGEDWQDAKLTLSTLSVTRGTAAPALHGQKIAIYERPVPRPMAVGRAAPAEVQATMSAMADAEARQRKNAPAPLAKPIEEAHASIEAGAYQTEFAVPGKVSLASGSGEKSVRLASEKLETKVVVRAAPVLDPTAYLEASFRQGDEAPLLPGEVLLSRDGAFIGRGHLPLVAPGDTAKLGFGSDERVKIARVPVSRQSREPGLLSSTKTDEFQFRTTVRNLHGFPVALSLEDRMPVSEDQSVTVERMSEMTRPDIETPDDRRGVFVWTPVLKPQEEKAFLTAYRIRWPAAKQTVLTPLRR